MSSSVFNVLSIDWDYFINVDGTFRYHHFPDMPNEKYPKQMQNVVWTSRYSEDDEILKVGYNPVVHDIMRLIGEVPFVVVAESHRWIYTYLVQRLRLAGKKEISLLNLDFHSDFREGAAELDCGNWLSILMEQHKGDYRWLGWEDSYRDNIPKRLEFFTDVERAKREIKDTAWDMLFICRSDMWSPPHLDAAFTNVFKPFIDGCNGDIQKGIWDSRYDDEMKKNIQSLKKAMDDFRNRNCP